MAKDSKPETFPKIAGDAKIKEVISKVKFVDLRFNGLQLTPNQIGDLSRWQQQEDHIRVTIEQLPNPQGELPLGDD